MMTESLLHRTEDLDRQIEALERRLKRRSWTFLGRRLGGWLFWSTLVVGIGFGMNSQGRAVQRERPDSTPPLKKPASSSTELVTQALKIVGPDGKTRLALNAGDFGGRLNVLSKNGVACLSAEVRDHPELIVNATDGSLRAGASVTSDGRFGTLAIVREKYLVGLLRGINDGGHLELRAPTSSKNLRLAFSVEAGQNRGLLNFFDSGENRTVFLGSSVDDASGSFSLFHKSGQPCSSVNASNTGGVLDFFSTDNRKGGCFFGMPKDSKQPLLNLLGSTDASSVILKEDDYEGVRSGYLSLHGLNKKGRLFVVGNRQGGMIAVQDPEGRTGAVLGLDGDGAGGILRLSHIQGKGRVLIGVTPNGSGDAQATNASGQTIGSLR